MDRVNTHRHRIINIKIFSLATITNTYPLPTHTQGRLILIVNTYSWLTHGRCQHILIANTCQWSTHCQHILMPNTYQCPTHCQHIHSQLIVIGKIYSLPTLTHGQYAYANTYLLPIYDQRILITNTYPLLTHSHVTPMTNTHGHD